MVKLEDSGNLDNGSRRSSVWQWKGGARGCKVAGVIGSPLCPYQHEIQAISVGLIHIHFNGGVVVLDHPRQAPQKILEESRVGRIGQIGLKRLGDGGQTV